VLAEHSEKAERLTILASIEQQLHLCLGYITSLHVLKPVLLIDESKLG
jgi:hypothetical protein